jgi:hypothetical protein
VLKHGRHLLILFRSIRRLNPLPHWAKRGGNAHFEHSRLGLDPRTASELIDLLTDEHMAQLDRIWMDELQATNSGQRVEGTPPVHVLAGQEEFRPHRGAVQLCGRIQRVSAALPLRPPMSSEDPSMTPDLPSALSRRSSVVIGEREKMR